jgi:hypothetical protein
MYQELPCSCHILWAPANLVLIEKRDKRRTYNGHPIIQRKIPFLNLGMVFFFSANRLVILKLRLVRYKLVKGKFLFQNK